MKIRGLVALFLAGASAMASAAASQPARVPSPAKVTSGETLAGDPVEIIVTAQKRSQLLIDVPQSVTVVSGATLDQQHATNFQDYLKLVPGLQLNQDRSGEGRLILRGINTGGVASTVSVYVDETPFGSSSGLVNGAVLAGDFDTFDLDRIEVLRGPQGTLYGASSLGGVLRFVTTLPSTKNVEAKARVGVEAVNGGTLGYSGNVMMNVPLSSTLALRASGNYRKDGGFIDSVGRGGSDIARNVNGDKSFGERASLLFKPSDTASVRLSAYSQDIDARAPTLIEADPITLERSNGLTQSQFVPQFSQLRYRVFNVTGTFGLGFANLTSSTSYTTQKQRERIDFTNALSPFLESVFGLPANDLFEAQSTNLKKFTQEIRLASQNRLVDWLVGGYHTDETGLIDQQFVAVLPGTLIPIDTVPILGTTLASAIVNSRYRETAGFANVTLHFGPQFDLDLGGRYSHNGQSAHQLSDGALAGGPNDFPVARSSENVFTYSIAPRFKPNRHATIYIRVAKGFRPGGPNVLPPGPIPADVPRIYHSDTVISYEAGIKAETSDRRFSIDAAVYHISWSNIQLFTTVSGFGVNANGSSARSDGFELTATARPVGGLDLSANAAYTDARLTGATPATVGGRDGDKLPFTPRLSLGVNATYEWRLGPQARAHLGGSFRHLSSQTADYDSDFVIANGRQRRVRPYNVADVFAGVSFGRLSVDAYVKNLNNSHGVTSTSALTVFGPSPDTGFSLAPGGSLGTGIIRPRTIGATLGVRY